MKKVINIKTFYLNSIKNFPFYLCSAKAETNIINENVEKSSNILEKKSKIEIKKYPKRRERENLKESINPIPLSSVLGPIEVEIVSNLKFVEKKYRWCSCGQSFTQPFCDGKHKGTLFKPVRFTVKQESKAISLCGCKFTENPPYCDGKTCFNLKNKNL